MIVLGLGAALIVASTLSALVVLLSIDVDRQSTSERLF
jgi:hypothetical protein